MKKNNIKYFTCKDFLNKKIIYGFFSRNGGNSKKPFDSLNCSLSSEDKYNNVKKNIDSAKNILKLNNINLKLVNQMHGTNIEIINENNLQKKIIADGIISQSKNISLAILTADCAPIFLIDPEYSMICALHAGWRGCLNNVCQNAVIKIKKMNKFKKNMIALIGPCLNQINFEVDYKFVDSFKKEDMEYSKYFKKDNENKKYFFDMRGLIEYQLNSLSINQVFHVNLDTFSEKGLFFSHRRAHKNNELPTGRMINIIGFK